MEELEEKSATPPPAEPLLCLKNRQSQGLMLNQKFSLSHHVYGNSDLESDLVFLLEDQGQAEEIQNRMTLTTGE